ncbi:ABC transporter permease [Mucisphaera calidilacus]|uniref:ABC-2 family transporter protein n=1 Tax=Mucisphaera calidilacus TaxID=2527982 RepID=A0A518BV06_9BACT|nr:hypothetical protein [Mucisphaera calidilacus]QDU70808.1 ABC-2 family transporter protein [Mucisphaera calidilacus]
MSGIANWFWRLVPANPLVVRIVGNASKRTPHLWLRCLFLGVLILMLALSLLVAGAFTTTGDAGQLAAAGSQLFATIAYGQLIILGLLAPMFLGSALSTERASQTLDVLLTTPLSNLQIVLGTLFGRLFFLVALLLSSIPLMAVVRLLGGVRGETILLAYTVAALMLYFLGAVAVTLSSWRVGGRNGVLFFVIGVGGYLLLVYGIDLWLLRPLDVNRATILTPLHPMLVLTTSVSPATYQTPTTAELVGYPWIFAWYRAHPLTVFTLITAGLGTLMLLASTITMRSGLTQRARRAEAKRSRASTQVWSNPVAWHECQRVGRGFFAVSARLILPITSVILTVLLLAFHAADTLTPALNNAGIQLASHNVVHRCVALLVILQMTVAILIGIFYASSTIAREREDGTLDLILTTPLGANRYLWGKVRGLLSGLLPMALGAVVTIAIPALYALVGTRLGWSSASFTVYTTVSATASAQREVPLVLPEAPLWLAITYIPVLAAVIAIGLARSITAKNVFAALVPTLLMGLALLAITGFVGMASAASGELFGAILNATNPLTHALMLIDPWTISVAFTDYPTAGRVALAVGSIVAAAIYSVFVYGRISMTIKGFDHAIRKRTHA